MPVLLEKIAVSSALATTCSWCLRVIFLINQHLFTRFFLVYSTTNTHVFQIDFPSPLLTYVLSVQEGDFALASTTPTTKLYCPEDTHSLWCPEDMAGLNISIISFQGHRCTAGSFFSFTEPVAELCGRRFMHWCVALVSLRFGLGVAAPVRSGVSGSQTSLQHEGSFSGNPGDSSPTGAVCATVAPTVLCFYCCAVLMPVNSHMDSYTISG